MSNIDLNTPDPDVTTPPQPEWSGPAPNRPWETRWNHQTSAGEPEKPQQYPNVELGQGPPQDIPRGQVPYEGHVRPGQPLSRDNAETFRKFGEIRERREQEAHDLQRTQAETDQRLAMERQHEAEMAPIRQALLDAARKEQQDAQQGQEGLREAAGNMEQQLEDERTAHNRGVLNGNWPAFKALMLVPMALAFAMAGRRGFRHSYGALYFLSGFTGALAQGNRHQANQSWNGYKENAKALMQDYKLKQEDLKRTLQNDKLNIEEKKLELQLKLAEWGDKKGEEALMRGGWEAFDKITEQADKDVQKLQDSIDKAESVKDKLMYKEENKLADDYSKEADKSIKEGEKHLKTALSLDKKIQASINDEERKKFQDEQRAAYALHQQAQEKTKAAIEAMTLARKHGAGKSREQIDKQSGFEHFSAAQKNGPGWVKKQIDKAKQLIAEEKITAAAAAEHLAAAGIDPTPIFNATGETQ